MIHKSKDFLIHKIGILEDVIKAKDAEIAALNLKLEEKEAKPAGMAMADKKKKEEVK